MEVFYSYSTCREEALKQLLGARYAEFETLSAVEKTSHVLGSKNWEDDYDALLLLVKEFIVAIWEMREQKLYGDDSYPGQLQRQPRLEIGVLLLELGVGLVSQVNLVSHMVRVRTIPLTHLVVQLARFFYIRESVDSLCRNGADTPMPPYIGKAFTHPASTRFYLGVHTVSNTTLRGVPARPQC